MAFGHVMHIHAGSLSLELAPLSKGDMGEFVKGGLQQRSITKYLNNRMAPVLEDEMEWYEKSRTDTSSVVWGIYDVSDQGRTLIGTTGLHGIGGTYVRRATSGILIFRQEYWGRGVATACHRARTMYALDQLGLECIRSAVILGNEASYKALWGVGYETVAIERNTVFVDGSLCHQRNLELINPDSHAWSRWWGSDRPTARFRAARKRTLAALEQAHAEVLLA